MQINLSKSAENWWKFFKHQRKTIDNDVKIKLSRKRLYPVDSAKYLGIRIDKNLNWKHHANDIAIKFNRANALSLKIRNFVNVNTLKIIFYAIFDSHISYVNVILAQTFNFVNRVFTLQKRSWELLDCHSSPFFKKQNLLKLEDKI